MNYSRTYSFTDVGLYMSSVCFAPWGKSCSELFYQ